MLTLVGGFFLYLNYFVEKPAVEKFPDSIWELALDKIDDSWSRGVDIFDEQFVKNCPQYTSSSEVPRELRSCNATLMSCYYFKRIEKLSYKKNWFEMELQFSSDDERSLKIYSPAEEAIHQAKKMATEVTIHLKSGVGRESKKIYLENTCRQVTLPQGFYRFGTQSANAMWHPSKISYSVDRYLVRNIDIEEWQKQVNILEQGGVVKFDKEKPYSAAISLSQIQMRKYCAFRGGQVLSSRVLDTITYHHGRAHINEISDRAPGSNTSPYPFGVRLTDSPHYFALKKGAAASTESCSKIFSRECLKLTNNSSMWGLGWSGIFEILGGPLEYVENTEMPRRNLKISSYYFPLKSRVHMAGTRGYWNGLDYSKPSSFNFFRYTPIEDKSGYKVGFRCMKLGEEE